MKNLLIVNLSVVCLLYLSCSKGGNNQNGPTSNGSAAIKIEIVSGSGQTDTVGKQLQTAITVKVTQNGTPVSGYGVEFQASGCNQDYPLTLNTKSDGTVGYLWYLAGDVGPQTLKAYALNAQNIKVDSVSASATGLEAGPGWHRSACSWPFGYTISSICKLSSGLLFASFVDGIAYLRYSSDNGISWNPVKGLGNGHRFGWVLSTPTDEIFAFADDGTFYSTDAGQTWNTLPVASEGAAITDAICTPSGKLLVATMGSISVSLDKGKTWTTTLYSKLVIPNSTGGDTEVFCPVEDKAGNIYIVCRETGTTFESSNNGTTWVPVSPSGERDYCFFIDNNDWFYKSRSDSNGGIYVSKDKGVTYTQLVNAPNGFLDKLSVQSDGNYYYEDQTVGFFQSNGITSSVKNIFYIESTYSGPYILANNNNLVLVNGLTPIYYYKK